MVATIFTAKILAALCSMKLDMKSTCELIKFFILIKNFLCFQIMNCDSYSALEELERGEVQFSCASGGDFGNGDQVHGVVQSSVYCRQVNSSTLSYEVLTLPTHANSDILLKGACNCVVRNRILLNPKAHSTTINLNQKSFC